MSRRQFDCSWYTEQESAIERADVEAAIARRRRAAVVDDGHVYVVQFGSGVIKVGKSTSPAGRLLTYAKNARVHGNTIAQAWVSDRHTQCSGTERKLIDLGAQLGTRLSREYFTGLDFEAVREYAQRIVLDRRRREYLERLAGAVGGDMSATWECAQTALDAVDGA